MSPSYYVYILTNKHHSVLCTGVTGNIHERVEQHKQGKGSHFTRRYNINKLVYLEEFQDIRYAIDREKQLKAGSRQKKLDLIESINPAWRDLSEDLLLF